ncbi:hypothetical protein HMPREF2565_10545 [Corynebacterium sp. HMSC072A04]|nr:hypothetical protein HMPREF2565_10545 [Corynebacterium sp. HMSC072A04]
MPTAVLARGDALGGEQDCIVSCMSTIQPIEYVAVKGFASIKDVKLTLAPDVTVLIGANGAGKSNIIRSFELMAHIMKSRLQNYVLARGGMNNLLHVGPQGRDSALSLNVQFSPKDADTSNGYIARLRSTDEDSAFLEEWLTFHDRKKYAAPYDSPLPAGTETALEKLSGKEQRFAEYVRPLLAGIRVFHFDDVGSQAPPKTFSSVADNLSLHPDAGNIAAYLLRLKAELPDDYFEIVSAIRNVAPFFDDFVLVPEGASQDNVRLRWTQKNLDTVFNAAQLSDGTLRFICLATLLLAPDRPQCIVLDEPELGLHPHAIVQLAALLRKAAHAGRQCVVATQSALLLDEFSVHNVAVLTRNNGESQVVSPSEEQLEAFLSDYTLGEMWRMNLLGGNLRYEEAL